MCIAERATKQNTYQQKTPKIDFNIYYSIIKSDC